MTYNEPYLLHTMSLTHCFYINLNICSGLLLFFYFIYFQSLTFLRYVFSCFTLFFFSLCLLKTPFFLKKCTTPTKKERERTSFQFLSLFPMPPKQKVTKQSSKALLKRVGTEQMSSAKAGSLLERAQDAAETERAQVQLPCVQHCTSSTSRQ
jgi:hypothetical protein